MPLAEDISSAHLTIEGHPNYQWYGTGHENASQPFDHAVDEDWSTSWYVNDGSAGWLEGYVYENYSISDPFFRNFSIGMVMSQFPYDYPNQAMEEFLDTWNGTNWISCTTGDCNECSYTGSSQNYNITCPLEEESISENILQTRTRLYGCWLGACLGTGPYAYEFVESNVTNFTESTAPINPTLDVGQFDASYEWTYSGEFNTTETTSDISSEMLAYLNNETLCPTTSETCDVPLKLSSINGTMRIIGLEINYSSYDSSAPEVYSISINPNPANSSQNVNVAVNVSDLNLISVNATLESSAADLTYNSGTGLYEGTITTPSEGEYEIVIISQDWQNYTTTNHTSINVTSQIAELTTSEEDISYSSSELYENNNISIDTIVYNYGETDANNFQVGLTVDGSIQDSQIISVTALSNSSTTLTFLGEYGEHNITIHIDSIETISESNETNNNVTILLDILDATAPIIESISIPSVYEGSTISYGVNASDENGIDSVTVELDSSLTLLTYNSGTDLYEGSNTAPSAGLYNATITVTDLNNLTTSQVEEVEIYSTTPDLRVVSSGTFFSPYPIKENEATNISFTVENTGATDALDFVTEVYIDGSSERSINQSVLSGSIDVGLVNYTFDYGDHNITFVVDADSNITESDETNNQLTISVFAEDNTAPTINELDVTDSVYVSSTISIQANVTDNVNLSSVNGTLNGTGFSLAYNSSSGLYEGQTTAPSTAGEYGLFVTAEDIYGLQSTRDQVITVNSNQADLTFQTGDIVLSSPSPSEPEVIEVEVTTRNEGGSDANNFVLHFTVNGDSQEETISVAAGSTETTSFNWTSVYSNHTITVTADYYDDISESNEGNNEYTKELYVLDTLPPAAPTVFATPDNWTDQTTHSISWSSVNDTNGIDHYEYQINYGSWTDVGMNTSFTTPSLADGIHTIYVRAVDTPGNLGSQGSVNVYIDTTNPNAPVLREWHTGSTWSSHNTPYYTWSDPGDIGSGVTAYVGNMNGMEVELYDNLSYHPTMFSGEHTFKIYAQDAIEHNSSWSNEVTVYIDIDDPSETNISSTTHPDNTIWYNESIPLVEFEASDEHSGVRGYYYLVDKNESTVPETMMPWTTNGTVEISSVSGTVSSSNSTNSSSGLPDGEWWIHARAKDYVGNLGQEEHYNLLIDSSAPTIIATIPNETSADSMPLIGVEYYDRYSGVNTSSIIFIVDGMDVSNYSSANSTNVGVTPPTPLSNGTHNASVQVSDNAGNTVVTYWEFELDLVSEEGARAAIALGVNESALSSYENFSDQYIAVSYLNESEKYGLFDTVVIFGEQTWGFNFITENETATGVTGLNNDPLVIWENDSLTTDEIREQVATLINETKW